MSCINLKGGVAKTTTSIAVAAIPGERISQTCPVHDLDPQTNATINLIGEAEWQKRDEAGLYSCSSPLRTN